MTPDHAPSSPLLAAVKAHQDAGHKVTILQCLPCGATGTRAPASLGIPLRPSAPPPPGG